MVDSLCGPDVTIRMQRLFKYVGNLSKNTAVEVFDDFFSPIEHPIVGHEEQKSNNPEKLPHVKQVESNFLLFAFAFARSRRFSSNKTVVFLSILRRVLDFDASNDLNSMTQSFQLFKELILLHSCERPPWTTKVFSKEDVECISEYILKTYFLHHGVYKKLLATQRKLNIEHYQPGQVGEIIALPELQEMSMLEGEQADDLLRNSPFRAAVELPPTSSEQHSQETDGAALEGCSPVQDAGSEQSVELSGSLEQAINSAVVAPDIETVVPQATSLLEGLDTDQQMAVLHAAREIVASKMRQQILATAAAEGSVIEEYETGESTERCA